MRRAFGTGRSWLGVKREAAWKKLWVVVSDEGGRPEEWSERRRKEAKALHKRFGDQTGGEEVGRRW